MKKLIVAFGLSCTLLCASAFAQKTNTILHVINRQGQPVAHAQVLIGNQVDQPFVNNFLETDGDGAIIAPVQWIQPLDITIDAKGYVRTTYIAQTAQDQNLMINAVAQPVELTGVTTGYADLQKDDILDVALCMPSVSSRDLFTLNLSDLISTEMDTMSAAGQTVNVPSNFSIPEQKESYIVPLTLKKPIYRMKLDPQITTDMVALHARFGFHKLIGDLRSGKSYFDVLNDVKFTGAGVRAITSNPLDLDVSKYTFNTDLTVKSPTFDPALTMIAISAFKEGAKWVPTDVKTLAPNAQMNLKNMSGKDIAVYSILGQKIQRSNGSPDLAPSMSLTLSQGTSATPQFLAQVAAPILNGAQVDLKAPVAINGVTPLMTYISLSRVDSTATADIFLEKIDKVWEVFAPAWVTQIQVPKMPGPSITGTFQRLEVMYIGGAQAASQIGPQTFDLATHATRNSSDF